MTGFDETVPPDDDPAHDSAVPAVEDAPDPDEPGGETQPKPDVDLEQDDELRAGQYGATPDG